MLLWTTAHMQLAGFDVSFITREENSYDTANILVSYENEYFTQSRLRNNTEISHMIFSVTASSSTSLVLQRIITK